MQANVQNDPSYAAPAEPGAPVEPGPVDRVVAVLGLGYVGLPTALGLRDAGSEVIGLDTSGPRLETIRRGEADLLGCDQRRLRRALLDGGRFRLTSDTALLPSADALLICVPTPVDEHFVPDLTALRAACATVVGQARPGQLIVLTSTTVVGATRELLVDPLQARGLAVGRDVQVAFSPERIDPGRPDHLPRHTARVVGGATDSCTQRAHHLLSRLTDAGVHAVRSLEVAEMVKLHENAFRAVNLALANELAAASRAFGLDPLEVIDAAATKPYGYLRHLPGPGVGGHCIPCDPHYLLWQLRERRVAAPVTEQAMAAIAARPGEVAARIVAALAELGRAVRGARVIVVGVSYKPGVADLRSSPALEIIGYLRGKGADVHYWDPLVPVLPLDGGALTSEADPRGADYDLALVHTLQPAGGHDWVRWCPVVLDASYGYLDAPHREVV
jgi:UDP-N-acetyl-D-glucosamine dehydrogenase